MKEIEISRIRPNPLQPRRAFPEDELEELAASIREHGVLQPILVKLSEGGYELVSGERRWRACKIAGLTTVPAIMVDPEDSLGSLTMALVENVQRADLGAIELAVAFDALQNEFGRTHEEIARIVGKSRTYITNTVRLLELDKPIREALSENKITSGHARALLMAPPDRRNVLFERILREGVSVRQVENAARAASREQNNGTDKPGKSMPAITDVAVSRMVSEMEQTVETGLGRKCIINRGSDGKGRMILEFYSDRDLEALVGKLQGK